MKRDNFKNEILIDNIDLHHLYFEKDQEILLMRKTFT